MNLLWTLEVIPLSWKIVILSPVYKRGSPFCPKNYRPISLLSNLFKLFERVLDARIRAVVRLIEEQCGFRPLFGSDTQLLRVSILLQYCKSHGIGCDWLSLTWRKPLREHGDMVSCTSCGWLGLEVNVGVWCVTSSQKLLPLLEQTLVIPQNSGWKKVYSKVVYWLRYFLLFL